MDQHQRRETFDQVASLYDQARPGYPEALFEDVIAFSNIPADGLILEIGCGTGQATLPFARRGYRIHCIELGADLAALAKRNLAQYPNVAVSNDSFETWPIQNGIYDLVISATAFHWIDAAIRYQKTAQALRPGGAIALFWNTHVQTSISTDFFQAVQEVYLRFAPDLAAEFKGLPHPDNAPTPVKNEIEHSDLYTHVHVRKYKWDEIYNKEAYINLLNTHSDHRALEGAARAQLFQEVGELIDTQFAGHITREYLTMLYLAKRK